MKGPIILLCALAVASSAAYAARNDLLLSLPLGSSSSQLDKSTTTNFCQGCRSLVSYAARFNSSSQRENNKKVLKNYCETIYPPSTDFQQGPCPIFVEGTFYLLDRIDPVTHCDEIGACGHNEITSTEITITELAKDGGVCDMCEQMITQVQAQLENPTFIDMIKRQVTTFCDYLAVINESKECRQMFESYIDEAIDFIRQIEPLKACQSISLCSASRQQMPYNLPSTFSKKFNQAPSLASYQGFGIETKVILGDQVVKDLTSPQGLVKGHNPNCMFCKTLVKELFKFLRENRTEDNIRVGLDKVCKLVYKNPAKLEQCESFVAAYSKELVQMLVDETDPELICMLLEQCTYQSALNQASPPVVEKVAEVSAEEPTDLNALISMLDSSVQLGSIGTCVECKLFIQYLRNEIENPKSEDQIKNWLLTHLCDSLEEKKAKDSCVSMVNTYAATFFKAVATDMDPKKACIELGACTQRVRLQTLNPLNNRPMIAHYIKVEKAPVKSTYCDQCVQIVRQIDDYLSQHPIDHDVNVLVDEVCNKLPNESSKSECTVMVKMFGQDIAQAISTMDNPKQLCAKIMLC